MVQFCACGEPMTPRYSDYVYGCAACDIVEDASAVHARNELLRVVWIFEPRVTYSKEVKKVDLLPDGTVRNMPGAKWEKWP